MTVVGSRYLRIGIICPYSLTIPGGVQAQVLGLARSLGELGHEARVLAPCDGPPPDSMVTPLGKSVPTATNGSMAPIAPDPACALRTIHALRNENFDVLALHEPLSPGPTLTALMVSNAPMVGTFHASGSNLAYEYAGWLAKRLSRKVSIRVAVSDDAARSARAALGGHYEIVNNGIEVERFANATPWPKQAKTIFFIGRHEDRKGLESLIAAVESIDDDDLRLWVGGTGPQTALLTERTKNDPRIEWLGRITDGEKARRMRAADVFCAPSLAGESFGIVLLEAMAARTAVVASDLTGYRWVTRDGLDARLCEPGNVEALAAELKAAVAGGMGERVDNGAKRADMFSMRRIAESYVELYNRAITNQHLN